ncbi:unnamed protein product [Camellia sinensis]
MSTPGDSSGYGTGSGYGSGNGSGSDSTESMTALLSAVSTMGSGIVSLAQGYGKTDEPKFGWACGEAGSVYEFRSV